MADLLRASLIFILMIALLRRKVAIGYVLLLSSAALSQLYRMSPSDLMTTAGAAATGSVAVKLLLSLSLIRIFELTLRERKLLDAMMETIRLSIRSKKAVMISMPLLIGMLPSLGGAYFSAPMVEEATRETSMSQEEKAFINYWFRHPWELILPLYPGIVFAAAVSHIPLNRLALTNLFSAAVMAGAGFIYSMRNHGGAAAGDEQQKSGRRLLPGPFLDFLPLVAIMLLVVPAGIELHYALLLVIIPLFLFYRYSPKQILAALRYGFSWDVFIMIAGIVFFKEVMERSGAVRNMGVFFLTHGISVLPLFCLLPFMAGLLTGHTVGFVGTTFPLLMSIGGEVSPALVSLAFVAGFAGVLLSPVHLCLVLTREYFRADLAGIYRKIAPACLLLFGAMAAQYLLL